MIKKISKLFKFIVAWFRIPKGVYCYKAKATEPFSDADYRVTPCPYWKKLKDRPHQEDGWCDYLGKGDSELLKTKTARITYIAPNTFTDLKVGDEVEGFSLLWDRCKECGIKMGEN